MLGVRRSLDATTAQNGRAGTARWVGLGEVEEDRGGWVWARVPGSGHVGQVEKVVQ